MNITIVSVGKLKEKYLKQGIDEYAKRLGSYCKFQVVEVPDEKAPENLSDKEMDSFALHGKSSMVFVIGGSLGLSPAVKKRADRKISFGRITLPHQLMRLVLTEQIYRAFRINAGHAYHK